MGKKAHADVGTYKRGRVVQDGYIKRQTMIVRDMKVAVRL